MKKKVIISYTTYSSSSETAALYISDILDKHNYEVKLLNITEYSTKLAKLSNTLFKDTSLEFLNGLLFGLINNRYASNRNEKYAFHAFDTDLLRKIFKSFNPDLVVSTHFYSSYIATYYNKINIINSKVITLITDYTNHQFWLANKDEVDAYIVHNDIIKNELIKKKVNPKKIYSYGIPLREEKILNKKEDTLKNYSLSGKKPIYLFLANDNSYEHIKLLIKKKFNIDIILICGKNNELKNKCEEFVHNHNIKNTLVLGHAKDIYNLINISTMVITKPGSAAINDLSQMQKPVILLSPQNSLESFNKRYMKKNHMALVTTTPRSLVRKIKLSLNYPFIIRAMKNKIIKHSEIDSTSKILDLIKELTR